MLLGKKKHVHVTCLCSINDSGITRDWSCELQIATSACYILLLHTTLCTVSSAKQSTVKLTAGSCILDRLLILHTAS